MRYLIVIIFLFLSGILGCATTNTNEQNIPVPTTAMRGQIADGLTTIYRIKK